MFVVPTGFKKTVEMGIEESKVSIGRDMVIGTGVGVGCAETTPLISKVVATASANPASVLGTPWRGKCNLIFARVESRGGDRTCILVLLRSGFRYSVFFAASGRIGCPLFSFLQKNPERVPTSC
jgi:hypothetical protein